MFAQFRSGLFRRIFAASAALSVFIMAATMAWSSMEYVERIRAETASRHGYMAQRVALFIGGFFQYSRLRLEMLAGFLKYAEPQEHELNAILNQISLEMPNMVEITVAGQPGAPAAPYMEDSPGGIPALQGSGAQESVIINRVDLDSNRIPRLELSVPVIYRGRIVKTVKARLSLKRLWLWVDEINMDPDTTIIVAKTDSGLVIADQKKELIGEIYPGFHSRTSGIGATSSGQPAYLSFHDIPSLGLTIGVSSVIPSHGAYIYQARYSLLAMLAGLTALAAALSYMFSVRAVRPVNTLIEAMSRYAERGERITGPLEGEYARIAEAFNHVADRLEANRKEMVAQESLVTLGRVSAILSHELRHGLQSISNEAHMLDAGKESKERLNAIVAGLASQVSSIMELARGSSVETSVADAVDIMEEARDLLALNGYSKGVRVTIAENLIRPLSVLADKRKIVLAITNLVRNSADAKAANVRLDARREGDMAVIAVSDDGDGFDPSLKEKIMEPFVTTKEKGYGLGLAFVRSVAIAHGGWLTMDLGQGRGCEARIYLPAVEPEGK